MGKSSIKACAASLRTLNALHFVTCAITNGPGGALPTAPGGTTVPLSSNGTAAMATTDPSLLAAAHPYPLNAHAHVNGPK